MKTEPVRARADAAIYVQLLVYLILAHKPDIYCIIVASAPAMTGFVLSLRFRLFVGTVWKI